MTRTYNPLPGWPIAAVATALWVLPKTKLWLPLAGLVGGYVVGPAVGHALSWMACRVDDALAELPDIDDHPHPEEGAAS